jgi:hypothetical protein
MRAETCRRRPIRVFFPAPKTNMSPGKTPGPDAGWTAPERVFGASAENVARRIK